MFAVSYFTLIVAPDGGEYKRLNWRNTTSLRLAWRIIDGLRRQGGAVDLTLEYPDGSFRAV